MKLALFLLSTVIITHAQTTYTTLTSQGDIDVFDSTKYVGGVAPPSAAGGCGTAYNLASASGTRIKVSLGEKICPGSSQAAGSMNAVTGDFWVDSGTVVLRGESPWGSNSKFSGIARITHDSSAASSPSTTHYDMSYTHITLNGKCDKTGGKYIPLMIFDVAAGSGKGGDIGSTASDGGQLSADSRDDNSCVKVDGWGTNYVFKSNLVTAGTRFVLSKAVLNDIPVFENSHFSDGTDWIAKHITVTNQRTSVGYAVVVCEAANCTAPTSGTRILQDLWVDGNGIRIAASPGAHIGLQTSELKIRVTDDTASPLDTSGFYPVYDESYWHDNLIFQKRTVAADIKGIAYSPHGLLDRTYLLNWHTAGCPGASDDNLVEIRNSASVWYRRWIIDRDCGYGAVFIAAVNGSAPTTFKVTESMIVGSPAALAITVNTGCTQSGSNYCPNMVVDRNTMPTVASTGTSVGLCTNHGTDTGWAGMCQSVQNNLVYSTTSISGGVVNFWNTPPNGAYGTVGHNSYYNISTPYQGSGTAIYSTAPGTGDLANTVNPQLTDRTRNFDSYCALYGLNTKDACFAALASGTSSTNPNLSITNLNDYVATGQVPQNQTFTSAGVTTTENPTATWIGAMPPLGVATPHLFYSDLKSGPATGGENGNGAFICVSGVNLGSSQGTSSVSLGGVAGLVKTWTHRSDNHPAPDKVCFQPGSGSVSGGMMVSVAGVRSNQLPFVVRSGNVWFVSPSGNDSAGGHTPATAKRTWVSTRASVADGDVTYLMGGVVTGIESDTSDGTYAWYKFPGGSLNYNMPRAFLGYPGTTLDLGDNSEVYAILGIGGYYTGTPGTNWVIGEMGVRCKATNRSCVHAGPGNRAIGNPGMHHDNRLVNIKVVAPAADTATSGSVTISDSYNTALYGLEFTNVGCGFGNTGGPDGSDSVNQSEQYRCSEYPLIYTISTDPSITGDATGTTITSASSLGEFTIGSHICANGSSCAAGQERIVTDAPSSTSLKINSPFSPHLSNVSTAHYVKPMSLYGGNPPIHNLYVGGMAYDIDLGWFYMHNNSSLKGLSQNPNYLGSAMVASTTANSEPGTGAALVTLSNTCADTASPFAGDKWICTSGDPVSIASYDNSGTAIGAGYDSSILGSYWMKVVNQTSFYLYADPELTQPVTGATNCSTNCGWFVHGVVGMWGFKVHDGYVAYQNGPALSFTGDNPVRGVDPMEIYNNVLAHTGQGPADRGNAFGGSIAMQNLNIAPSMANSYAASVGYATGEIRISHNTFYDINNWTAPDLGSGGLNSWFSKFGGFVANAHEPAITYTITNNIVHSPNSSRGLMALTAEPTYAGGTNIFYGGTFSADWGYPASPSIYQNSAINCSNPCALFSNASAGIFTLASATGPASGGGAITFVTRDALGNIRPQGGTPAIGAYEMVGASILGVAPTISTTTLPNAVATVPYNVTVQASGTSPLSWSVAAGSLPSWATLNPNTGAIAGTPSSGDVGSTALFSIRVTNAYGSATQPLSITVVGSTPLTRYVGIGFIGVTAK